MTSGRGLTHMSRKMGSDLPSNLAALVQKWQESKGNFITESMKKLGRGWKLLKRV